MTYSLLTYICLNFVVGSASPGGVLDRAIEAEAEQHSDFLRLVCYPSNTLGPI